MRRAFSLLLFLATLAIPASRLHAQAAPSPDAAPQGLPGDPNGNDDTSQSVATFRQNVNLVSLYFDVRDKKNLLIPHLTRDDCQVFEDKQPQTMKNFTAEVDQPLTLGILLDTSGSQQNVLPLEQQTGSAFLKRILRQKDQAFLVSFDVDIDLLSDFTSNPSALARDMDKAQINVGTGGITTGPLPTGTPRGTLLYDAVVEASHDKLAGETGRKAMILLTDGEDQGSRAKLRDAVEAAQKANSMVYVLLIADRGFYGGGMYSIGYTGDAAMHQLADQTGGRLIDVGNNGKKLEAAFQLIEDELRTQYVASYTPTNAKTDGTYRKVDIQCHQREEALKVQSRKGYYAVAPED
ncbi:MAG TPA: VWA domain-containing protein [Acidobacteriaceae bacterium]|jgi:VWFA-related protein